MNVMDLSDMRRVELDSPAGDPLYWFELGDWGRGYGAYLRRGGQPLGSPRADGGDFMTDQISELGRRFKAAVLAAEARIQNALHAAGVIDLDAETAVAMQAPPTEAGVLIVHGQVVPVADADVRIVCALFEGESLADGNTSGESLLTEALAVAGLNPLDYDLEGLATHVHRVEQEEEFTVVMMGFSGEDCLDISEAEIVAIAPRYRK